MKMRRLLSLTLALMMMSVFAVSAAALQYPSSSSHTCPYSTATVQISRGLLDKATATITACDCNPMENYLMASLKIQYQNGDNINWSPESGTTYYYSSDENTTQESQPITKANITYAKGWFVAECHSNGKDNSADFFLEDE